MARLTRMKFSDPEEGHYHIISRTVKQDMVLGDVEKEYFLKLLKKLSQVYFVRVATFAVMSNHVHLIVQMIPSAKVSDDDLRQRFDIYYNQGVPEHRQKLLFEEEYDRYRLRFGDLSCFVQDLKQRFARWYNRDHKLHGHFWSERFKSVLLGGTRALLACMVYVELNAVRAGLVDRPEEYRFCGLHHYLAGGRIAKWLDYGSLVFALSGMSLNREQSSKEKIKEYLHIVYSEGMEETYGKAALDEERCGYSVATDFEDLGILSFKRRIGYFSDGVMLGGKGFCDEKFSEFRAYFQTERERTGKLIKRRFKKRRRAAPEDALLHLHSIRSFERLES